MKIKAKAVKVDLYKLIARAVEEGVAMGLNRAHKYTDKPTRNEIAENVEREVLSEICELFVFEDPAG